MKKTINLAIFIVIITSLGYSQFGKNKVQYDSYNWSYLQSENMDIYFYTGGENLAEFAAPIGEQALKDICKVLNWRLRKRVTLVVYNSHSDFQQTNVTLSYLSEGIGGFTELFKNRAVVPFEGSYYDFWHVIRHELVHVVVNDMIYGGNVQSIISGRVRLNIPLWMNEGLAEYISYGWTAQTDLIMRDIALNSNIPNIEHLDYYSAYQGGNSVYRFIAEKYGIEKIGQIWAQMKSRGSADKGLKNAIGMDMKNLTDQWHRWMRTEYWPDVADRDEIQEIAVKLTDHKKLKNYFNTGPAISPLGDKIALMSNRKGYADIFLISAVDGKVIKRLVRGQRTPDLEELKWLNPRLSWSPDGKKITIAVKSGGRDALIIVDVATKKRQRLVFEDLEEIFTAAWSPEGNSIAFVGLKNGRTDLYLYNLDSSHLAQITNDEFPDFEPAWSPDGKKIVFSSQHPAENDTLPELVHIVGMKYLQTDLYCVDLTTKHITRLTDSPWSENYPVWAHNRDAIIYTSDHHGISNLYIMDMATRESRAITNVLTGVFQPSLSKDDLRLVFAGYADNGWDIYSISNPLDLWNDQKEIKPTVFAKTLMESWENPDAHDRFKFPSPGEMRTTRSRSMREVDNFTHYVFAPNYNNYEAAEEQDSTMLDTGITPMDSMRQTSSNGKYPIIPYKTRFSLDMVYSQAGYSNLWGLQGSTVFSFSDILGNHQLTFGTEMYIDLENSDYYLSYLYLAKRTNWGLTGFHTANFWYYSYFYMYRLRNYGIDFSISRPSSHYSRVEFGATSYNVEQKLIFTMTGETRSTYKISTILPRIGFVFDNSLWGYLCPIDGWRARVDFIASPKYRKNSIGFYSMQADIRRYLKVNMDYSFGLRLSTGFSNGKNAQRFFLGGEDNWVNYQYRNDIFRNDSTLAENIYFSDFITPLRGALYYERVGDRYFLFNLEFRYPFVKYLSLGWPLPIILGGIQGTTYLDFGSTWYDNELHPFRSDPVRGFMMDDLVAGYGFGSRIYLGYFVLKIDVAWRFDFYRTYSPRWYFSLGTDF